MSLAECVGRLYQVYYGFCFGMLAAGVTLYAKSIIPMVIWHSLVDVSAHHKKESHGTVKGTCRTHINVALYGKVS